MSAWFKMEVLSVFRDAIVKYERNPILLIPVTISALQAVVTNIVLSGFVASIRVEYFNLNAMLQSLALLFFYVIIVFVVGVVVTVGYAAMAARITEGKKCKFSDWEDGLRKYFLRILAITLLIVVLTALIGIGVAFAGIMSAFLNNRRLNPEMFRSGLTRPIIGLFATVFTVFSYCCYAAATVDDTNLSSSLTQGLKTLRRGGKSMLILFIILYAISEAASYALTPTIAPSRSLMPTIAAGRLSLTGIIATVVPILLTPLWYLVVFAIFRDVSVQFKK